MLLCMLICMMAKCMDSQSVLIYNGFSNAFKLILQHS
jgi:hypothetical protein